LAAREKKKEREKEQEANFYQRRKCSSLSNTKSMDEAGREEFWQADSGTTGGHLKKKGGETLEVSSEMYAREKKGVFGIFRLGVARVL